MCVRYSFKRVQPKKYNNMNLQSSFSKSQKITACLLLGIFLLESCTNFNIPTHSQSEKETKPPPTTHINLQQIGTSSLIEVVKEEEKSKENKDQMLAIQGLASKIKHSYSGYSGPQWGLTIEEVEYIFKTSKDFVCILEFGGHFKRLNQTWEEQLGWELQDLLDVPYINFVHPDDVEKTLAYEKEFTPTGLTNRYRCKDGTYCWIDWIGISSIRTEEPGKTNPYPLNIGRNVTIVKLLELKKERRHREAELCKKKSNFLAHMSHELRTPLTGLLGLLNLINKSNLPEEDLNYLNLAHNSGVHLLSVLNNILDVTKIEESQVKLEAIEFSPLSILEETVEILGLNAKEKDVKLNLITSPKVQHNLVGDPTRFRQILFNLIGNAIKFTNKGTVSVFLDANDTNEYCTLIGEISDTGIGISPEIQENLFSIFFQADASMLRKFGGTGLGLFISKKLCNMMGGDLTLLSSEEGKGSTFRFSLNLEKAKKEDILQIDMPTTTAPNNLANVRVLVVDDNTTTQLLLSSILKKEGCSVTSVFNGLEALEAVTTGGYDIVLMDGEMPVMDGLEATKKIRKSFSAESLPIIGVTAHAMIKDRERFLEVGMNGYLTKPIQKAGLFAEILRCLAETGHSAKPPEKS